MVIKCIELKGRKKCGNITILYTYRRRRRLHTLIFYTWDRMIFSPVLPTHPSHFHYFNTHTFQMLIFIWNCVCYSKVTRICYYSSISIGYRISKYDLFLGFATHCTFCVLENIAEEFFFCHPFSLAIFTGFFSFISGPDDDELSLHIMYPVFDFIHIQHIRHKKNGE